MHGNAGSRLTICVCLPTGYFAIEFSMQESDVLVAEIEAGLIPSHAYYILFIVLKELVINLRSLATMHLEQQPNPIHGQCIIHW